MVVNKELEKFIRICASWMKDYFNSKSTPVSGDILVIEDCEDSYIKKVTTIGDLPGTSGGSFQQDYSFCNDTQPYLGFNAVTWTVAARIIFRGSNVLGQPDQIKTILSCATAGMVAGIRIWDRTNSQQVAYKEYSNTEPAIVDLGTLSNISTGEVIWEIQMKRISAQGNPLIHLHALSIYF